MAEPTVHPAVDAVSRVMDRYDEQCANNPAWATEAAGEVAAVRNAIDRCRGAVARAVREQPTSSAEPVQYNGHNGLAVFADAPRRLNEGQVARPAAEPVSIADMSPGTTFIEEVRWTVTGTLSTGSTVAHSGSGEMRFADRFDPSTIRDVTPPKEQL